MSTWLQSTRNAFYGDGLCYFPVFFHFYRAGFLSAASQKPEAALQSSSILLIGQINPSSLLSISPLGPFAAFLSRVNSAISAILKVTSNKICMQIFFRVGRLSYKFIPGQPRKVFQFKKKKENTESKVSTDIHLWIKVSFVFFFFFCCCLGFFFFPFFKKNVNISSLSFFKRKGKRCPWWANDRRISEA